MIVDKCPECGSTERSSHGDSWDCKKCGRKYRKNPRGQYKKDIIEPYHLNKGEPSIIDSNMVTDI